MADWKTEILINDQITNWVTTYDESNGLEKLYLEFDASHETFESESKITVRKITNQNQHIDNGVEISFNVCNLLRIQITESPQALYTREINYSKEMDLFMFRYSIPMPTWQLGFDSTDIGC